jgi:hypothetical protein
LTLQTPWLSLQTALAAALVAALGLAVGLPTAASAKKKDKDRCARADARLVATGKGDRDGDGLSNCRERLVGSSLVDADSDDDGLDDGAEVADGCNPNAPDSDGDGIPDGEDPTPAPPAEQKLEAFLDALTCPTTGVPGSLTALGVTVVLDDATEFDDTTCEELAALLAEATEGVLVEVKILEDELGGLAATKVELEEDHDDGDDDDHDDGDDDDEDEGDDDDGDEGEDD